MTAGEPLPQSPPWYRRLHAALMPDYNRAATVYWWLATPIGALLLIGCLVQVSTLPALSILQVAAGMIFAIGAGLFPVRIPGTRVSFAVGELTIFLLLLLHGPAAAVVLAGAEAAVGSYRTSRRWTSRLGSPAMAALAMYAAAWMFETGRGALGSRGVDGAATLLALALVIGLVYFVFSATLIGATARLRRNQNLLQFSDLLGAFRWVGLAYAGSAAFATLLYLVYLQSGAAVLWVTVPLVSMLLLVLHFYYLQQEAQQRMRETLLDIARREEALQTRETESQSRHERELQMSERRFHGAFTHAAVGMVLLDLDGRTIECNEALARLLGRRSQDLLGMGFAVLLHADDRERFTSRLAMARDVHFEDFTQTLRLIGVDGRFRPVRVGCSFFHGPSMHRTDRPGKPCLMLQVQALDDPAGVEA